MRRSAPRRSLLLWPVGEGERTHVPGDARGGPPVKRPWKSKLGYRALGVLYVALLVFLIFLGVGASIAGDAETPEERAELWGGWKWASEHARNFTAPATAAIGLIALLRRAIGPAWVWRAVQRVLDQWQNSALGDRDGPRHAHRVTLFKARSFGLWLWPWDPMLAPFMRSGHMTQNSCIRWPIPDHGDGYGGVAGNAFKNRQVVAIANLPDVSGSPTPEQVREYASQTGVEEEWVRVNKPRARSFYGVPIEISGGRCWGVVVLDSREEHPIGKKKLAPEHESLVSALALLLERKAL